MKRVLLLAAVLLALGASSAAAQSRPFDAYEDGLYRIGIAYWNEGQPQGCEYLTRRVEDRWSEMGGAAGFGGDCEMEIAADMVAPGADPQEACRLAVHEVGHLLGHQHVDDGTNVMFPASLADVKIPACLDPTTSMAALPALPVARWPGEVAALQIKEERWASIHARCAGRRCWAKARRLRLALNAAWPKVTARRNREPVYG